MRNNIFTVVLTLFAQTWKRLALSRDPTRLKRKTGWSEIYTQTSGILESQNVFLIEHAFMQEMVEDMFLRVHCTHQNV